MMTWLSSVHHWLPLLAGLAVYWTLSLRAARRRRHRALERARAQAPMQTLNIAARHALEEHFREVAASAHNLGLGPGGVPIVPPVSGPRILPVPPHVWRHRDGTPCTHKVVCPRGAWPGGGGHGKPPGPDVELYVAEQAGPVGRVRTSPCPHIAAAAVRLRDPLTGEYTGELVAWWCPDCERRLPPDARTEHFG
jgi:hypothetical protein